MAALRLAGRGLVITALASSTGLGLSACSAAHPGAAAVVGSSRISIAQLDDSVSTMLNDSGTSGQASSNVSATRRSVLTRMIRDALVVAGAKVKGVSVSEGEVQSQLSAALQGEGGSQTQLNAVAAQQGIAAGDLHDYIYYALLEGKIADALTKNVTVQEVDAAHILVKDKATADKILAQVQADPSTFGALAKQYSTDTGSADNGGDLGYAPKGAYVEPFDTEVNTKPVGSIFEVQTQYGYHVVHIIDRKTVPVSQLDQNQAQQIQGQAFNTFLLSVAKGDRISVNPRYGSWDTSQLEVVAAPGDLSTPAASPSAALPGVPGVPTPAGQAPGSGAPESPAPAASPSAASSG